MLASRINPTAGRSGRPSVSKTSSVLRALWVALIIAGELGVFYWSLIGCQWPSVEIPQVCNFLKYIQDLLNTQHLPSAENARQSQANARSHDCRSSDSSLCVFGWWELVGASCATCALRAEHAKKLACYISTSARCCHLLGGHAREWESGAYSRGVSLHAFLH